ncbi:MAG: leucyl aminopeptidase [bacterium]|nr:leucyl aminopeptidase [bacterium]
MQYTTTLDAPLFEKVEAVIVPLSESECARLPAAYKPLDRALDGQLAAALAAGDFKGEEHTTCNLYTAGKIPASRVLLIGTGKGKDVSIIEWQHIVGTAARTLQATRVTRYALVLPAAYLKRVKPHELGALTAKGVLVSTYHFAEYKSDPAAKLPEPTQMIVGPLTAAADKQFVKGIEEGTIVGESMNWMRRFGDMPSSDATPTYLAKEAQSIAKSDKRFTVKIIEKAEMEKLGMGALLGVARGAETPPKCIVIEWRGDAHAKDTWRALVGKGITFDTGGISIKPSAAMDEMRYDMCGGGAVLGAMRAIGMLGLKANIVGIIPATDNMPGGRAQKPGDIVKTMRGKTIEVLNTDAEGRLVLADGLGYAQQYEPKAIVDLATLTGACVVALGHHYAAHFANNSALEKQVQEAVDRSGDRSWHMPLGDAYTREVKSDVADWQNLGKMDRAGGSITAAAFLEQFAEGRPWVHLDIAGTAWDTQPKPWRGKGATGFGVHLLVELAKKWSK